MTDDPRAVQWTAWFVVYDGDTRIGQMTDPTIWSSDVVPRVDEVVSWLDEHPYFELIHIAPHAPATVIRVQHQLNPGDGPSTIVFLRVQRRGDGSQLKNSPHWSADTAADTRWDSREG